MNRFILQKNLKKLRILLNLTQDDFAYPLGITGSYVSDIERGKSNPSDSLLCLIEINYRVNREWLLNDEGEPFVKEWVEDWDTLFNDNKGPILKDVSMQLEVITREEDERRKQAESKEVDQADPGEGIPIYNRKGQANPQKSGNMVTPDLPPKDPFSIAVTALRTIFDSDDPMLISTTQANLTTFAHAAAQHRHFRKQSEQLQKHDEEILKLKKHIEAGDVKVGDAGAGGDKTGTDL